MRLYHTSDREIRNPDLHRGRKNADFGQGFYLTPDREFTYRWAGREAVVNEYELDESGLLLHRFCRDKAWFRYIYDNRRVKDALEVDAVIGPIAIDTIFDTMGIVSSGFLSPEEALELLLIGPEYTQVAVKTEKALAQLHFIRAESVQRLDESLRREEQKAYEKVFAAAMERLMDRRAGQAD